MLFHRELIAILGSRVKFSGCTRTANLQKVALTLYTEPIFLFCTQLFQKVWWRIVIDVGHW